MNRKKLAQCKLIEFSNLVCQQSIIMKNYCEIEFLNRKTFETANCKLEELQSSHIWAPSKTPTNYMFYS